MSSSRCHPIFHVYLPTTLRNNLMLKLKNPQRYKLIGVWERYPPPLTLSSFELTEEKIPLKEHERLKSIDTVSLTIFGLQFEKNTESDLLINGQNFNVGEDPRLKIVGEVVTTGRTSRFAAESVELPPIWITLGFNDFDNIIVEQICLDNLMLLPEPNSIVIVEYNPDWLKYCIRDQGELTGVHSIILKAFDLAYLLPYDEDLIRLLPAIEEPERDTILNNSCLYKDTENGLAFNLLNRSLGLKQLFKKAVLVSEIGQCKRRIPFLNTVLVLLVDTIFGILLTSYLLQFPNLFSILHMKIDTVVKLLQQLLHWLRGSPAGFKLNSALNSLLWRFFSYHLHLWGNYIGILQPVLSFILTLLIQVGVLGLSVQVALVKDLLSITTFHIYCLYIYATRLFAIQLRALKSLGRLFFGRKWNPLRNRVDSIQLNTSEMFVSSLIFTIAIFLTPTTIIYYVVFLLLRLPVLILESLLSYTVTTINSLKIATFFLILSNSPRVTDEIYLQPVNKDGILMFELRIQTKRKLFELPNIFAISGRTVQKILQGNLLISS